MKKICSRPLPLLLLLFVLFFCEKDFDADRPFARLITLQPTDLDEKGITLHGEFLDLRGGEMSEYGFLIDLNPIIPATAPTPHVLRYAIKNENPKVGVFDFRAEYGLMVDQIYFIRAYAIQGDKIIIGQEFTFKSKGGAANATITDFAPKNVVPGDTVVIKGTNFTFGSLPISASFGSIDAQIIGTPSNTEIKVRAPLKMPAAGRLDLKLGFINVRAEQIFIRLRPVVVRVPNTIAYGEPFLIECKNLSKFPSTNQVRFGYRDSHETLLVLQENKNSLLVKLDDQYSYNFGDSLYVFAENLLASTAIKIAPPVLLGISPRTGVPESEITLSSTGVSLHKGVTKVLLNQNTIEEDNFSIRNGGTLITVELPYWAHKLPGENTLSIICGQRKSAEMSINMDIDWVKLNAVQKNWQYAFNLNNKIYVGLPLSGSPMAVFNPAQNNAKLEAVSASFSQIPIYAAPLAAGQVLALNLEGRTLEGQILNVFPNNSIQQLAKSENKLNLQTNNSDAPVINAVALSSNSLMYLYVSNGVNNFWEFNPNTRQFKPLTNLRFSERYKLNGITLFDQGSRISALINYDNGQVELQEFRPDQNTWQFAGGTQHNILFNDATQWVLNNDLQFILSSNQTDQYVTWNPNRGFNSSLSALARKDRPRSKKKVFFINDRLWVIDDESIYRTRLYY